MQLGTVGRQTQYVQYVGPWFFTRACSRQLRGPWVDLLRPHLLHPEEMSFAPNAPAWPAALLPNAVASWIITHHPASCLKLLKTFKHTLIDRPSQYLLLLLVVNHIVEACISEVLFLISLAWPLWVKLAQCLSLSWKTCVSVGLEAIHSSKLFLLFKALYAILVSYDAMNNQWYAIYTMVV